MKREYKRKEDIANNSMNKVTMNKYPILLVQDLMDKVSKACWFTKLNLRSSY